MKKIIILCCLCLIAQILYSEAETSKDPGESINAQEQIIALEENINLLENKIQDSISYGIIAGAGVCLLIILLFILLLILLIIKTNRIKKNIRLTFGELQEQGIKLDKRFTEILENQLLFMAEDENPLFAEKQGHSLVLKVADEIIRIQKNLKQMDTAVKGHKQLAASVKRMVDNFSANGYDIVDMLGHEYNDGMKVSAHFIPDQSLDPGQRIISRIIKPQVNYKGVMIQSAQVEVSQGE